MRGKIKGLDKLSKRLAKKFSKETIDKGLEVTARRAKVTAITLCPYRTGALQRSIYSRVRNSKLQLGATALHAPFVEYGWIGSPAQPFLRPAAAEAKANMKKDILNAIKHSK